MLCTNINCYKKGCGHTAMTMANESHCGGLLYTVPQVNLSSIKIWMMSIMSWPGYD